jgi:hypothetical protein
MKKRKTINLKLVTVRVKPRIIKTRFKLKIGKPIFDCCDDECAQAHGFANREDYRKKMNTKKGYNEVTELMGKI